MAQHLFRTAALIATVALLAGSWALAVDKDKMAQDKAVQGKALTHLEPTGLRKGSELIGKNLRNVEGQDVGKVEDIVVDNRNGRVSYAVVSFGGFMGMGDKFFAVPFQALRQDPGAEYLIFPVAREKLQVAQGFDKNTWPNLSNPEWNLKSYQQYGIKPYWQEQDRRMDKKLDQKQQLKENQQTQAELNAQRRADENRELPLALSRVSQLIGMDVKARGADDKVADLNDTMIDMREGRLIYALLDYNGKFALVPWSALDVLAKDNVIALDAERAVLDRIAFEQATWPNLSDSTWAVQLHREFNREPYWEVFGYEAPGETPKHDMRGGMKADKEYKAVYDVSQAKTLEGRVTNVKRDMRLGANNDFCRLIVQADDGKSFTVDVAPQAFLDTKAFKINEGDRIIVSGAITQHDGAQVLLARQITKDGQNLELRSQAGQPHWR